jgi:3-oxoacyl-[acyl-carrier-protein] synthase II
MSADAFHMTAPDPDGKGASLVMKWAIEDAGLKIEDVDYINVHGTSTPLVILLNRKPFKKHLATTPTK